MKRLIRALAPLCIAASLPSAALGQTVSPAVPQVGLITVGLNVADMDRSLKFYVEGLGMKALRRNERADTVEQFLGFPAMSVPPVLELIARKTPAQSAPPATTSFKIVLTVNDIVALAEQLKKAGFAPPPPRMNSEAGGGAFFIRDPDGYNLEIVQRGPSPAR